MHFLNKLVWAMMSPHSIAWMILLASAVSILLFRRRRRYAKFGLIFGLVWLWMWSAPILVYVLGIPLEREFLSDARTIPVEQFPAADVIVLLGGSMGGNTNVSEYAEITQSADRVWQAARLYKAGKAPRIFVTGKGNEWTTKGVLTNFGVPTNAMVFVDQARNTEEEAKAVAALCSTLNFASTKPKALVVTSAWHMRRAKLMFDKYAPNLEVVPAPADFEATVGAANGGINFMSFLPSPGALAANEVYLHEWVGYYWYKWFR